MLRFTIKATITLLWFLFLSAKTVDAQSEFFKEGLDGVVLGAGIARSSAAYGYSLSFGYSEDDNFDLAVSYTSLTTSFSRKSKPILAVVTFLQVRYENGGYGIGVGVAEDINGDSNRAIAIFVSAYERLSISRSFIIIPKLTFAPISSNMFRDKKLESLPLFSTDITFVLPKIIPYVRPFIGARLIRWEGKTISGINIGIITSFGNRL